MTEVAEERFDPDLLSEEDQFEIDAQAAHLFKHPNLGIDDLTRCRPIGCYEASRSLAAQYRRDR